MKNSSYPDKNRWVATFMLGQIMGDKSAPFIAKFSEHPNWVLRMASLKTLLALKQEQYGNVYSKLLSDKAFLVRVQALENIRALKMESQAPFVWAMLYDKQNYYANPNSTKRTNIIKDVIVTIGELKFKQAVGPLLTMIDKEKYDDIFEEMDKALAQITEKKSPEGNRSIKRNYWQRFHNSQKTI
jgi:HEAT repeat protein